MRYLLIIIVCTILGACGEQVEQNEKIPGATEMLASVDSTDVWTSQWYDYYDTSDCSFKFGETYYGGVIYTYLDSIFFLSSGAGLTSVLTISEENQTRYTVENGCKKYWYFSGDTLKIESKGAYFLDESEKYYIVQTYLRRKVPANELLEVLNAGIEKQDFIHRDTFLSIDMSSWVEADLNLIKPVLCK